MVGGTLAWSVLDTATRAVGVIAYRYGIVADLAEDGALDQAQLRVTIHGVDGCESFEEGLLVPALADTEPHRAAQDRKSTRLNSSHVAISYAVFRLKKK